MFSYRVIAQNTAAIAIGLVVGSAFNMGLIELNTAAFFPPRLGLDLTDPEGLNQYIQELPPHAFVLVILAHLGQAFVGGWVAARLAASRPILLSMSIGVLSLLGGLLMMQMVDGPRWMLVELPLYLIVAWVAGRVEEQRRARKQAV